jgi:hypothetical protein
LLFRWNPHCRIEVNPKSNLIFFYVFFISFFSFLSPFVELLSWFVNDGRSFYFFYLRYGHEKHKNYKKLVFICSSIVVWFLGFKLRKEAKMKKKTKKNKLKHMRGWNLDPYFLVLIDAPPNSLVDLIVSLNVKTTKG